MATMEEEACGALWLHRPRAMIMSYAHALKSSSCVWRFEVQGGMSGAIFKEMMTPEGSTSEAKEGIKPEGNVSRVSERMTPEGSMCGVKDLALHSSSEPVAKLFLRASTTSFKIGRENEEDLETSRAKDVMFYYHLNSLIKLEAGLEEDASLDLEAESILDTARMSYLQHSLAKQVIENEVQLINFLQEFFSAHLIDEVKATLDLARGSTLGIEYVYRGTFWSFALKLLYHACTLATALSTVSLSSAKDIEEWKTVGLRRKRLKNYGGSGAGRGGPGGPGGAGGGRGDPGGRGDQGRGGSGRGRGNRGSGGESTENEFSVMNAQEIPVPFFLSPKRPTKETTVDDRLDRRFSVRERAETFMADPSFSEFGVEGIYFYKLDDPADMDRTVTIYHGTRRSHQDKFCKLGIRSSVSNNEFSTETAFYYTNYLQYAYEHAILNHPGNSWWFAGRDKFGDPGLQLNNVVVLQFSINTNVLHGYVPPGQGEAPFKTCWFQIDNQEWRDFCLANLEGKKSKEEYDIAFGPICITAWKVVEPVKGKEVGPVKASEGSSRGSNSVKLEKAKFINSCVKIENQQVDQIAFLSRRSQLWLQRCLQGMLMERRIEIS